MKAKNSTTSALGLADKKCREVRAGLKAISAGLPASTIMPRLRAALAELNQRIIELATK